ncbi:VWFA-related protein [Silvibacterium bohemicum]|uniref:VWFA-related protein n=1 Tax=Silvibacterium bohemicum TaxID=1577686 RepID=A0A841JS69_9BACT|nr:VWA domain-containing protein [Silvibacterium bohemicum]MBB6143367.1 VWFA-related protein [Silvibacterium bohemicum]
MRLLGTSLTRFAACALLAAASAAAQQVGQNTSPNASGTYTLSVKSQLVVETVVVKDKQGNYIQGLTEKDFALTEDGVTQKISFCEHQDLVKNAEPMPVAAPGSEEIKLYNRLTRTQVVPESPDSERYKNRRLLALYFDMSAMRPADQLRALSAAEQFVRTQMTTVDLISILRYQGGSVDILQDFSSDRNKLLSILETLVVGEGQGSAETIDDASSADTGAAFGQDDSEFNVFNTDRQLSALQTAAQMLGQLNEKKSLIYFAGGLRLNGIDNQAQLHATVDAAIKAGVTFWPVDARGLVAQAPLGDATQGSPGNSGLYTGAAALATTTNFQQSQDTLFTLAEDTGGKALFDNNDLTRGIVQAQQSVSDYYILGYYTTNTARNGHFRKIKVALTNDVGASLSYRQGYYADKEFSRFTAVDKERQLEDALMLKNPITELSIAMEIDHFQLNRAEYFVPIIVKIPGRELALAKRGGAEHTLIDFVGEIKDMVDGSTVSNVRDNVNIKLSDATAAELAKRPIEYDTGFTLLPGKYMIKFLARDDETGRIGTYQTVFVIPNLNKEEKHVPISSVVLSSQRVALQDALFDTEKSKDREKEIAVNPLVQDGKKLVPSVTRVFSTSREIYVYLQAYKQSAAGSAVSTATASASANQPLFAFVSLYLADKKVFETPPTATVPSTASRLGTMPLTFSLGVAGLAAGEYDCQVTVLDPATLKTTFWRAPIVLVP